MTCILAVAADILPLISHQRAHEAALFKRHSVTYERCWLRISSIINRAVSHHCEASCLGEMTPMLGVRAVGLRYDAALASKSLPPGIELFTHYGAVGCGKIQAVVAMRSRTVGTGTVRRRRLRTPVRFEAKPWGQRWILPSLPCTRPTRLPRLHAADSMVSILRSVSLNPKISHRIKWRGRAIHTHAAGPILAEALQ